MENTWYTVVNRLVRFLNLFLTTNIYKNCNLLNDSFWFFCIFANIFSQGKS